MSWTGTKGYVINANGEEGWLHRFKPPGKCPLDCMGEPTDFDHQKLGHQEVSNLLKARLAVWAFTVVPRIRDRPRDDSSPVVETMHSADVHGRVLATVLRSEIGPGPTIIYMDLIPQILGGPDCWRITDEGKPVPYWHRPSAGYVIGDKEYGGWAWEYRPAGESMLGRNVGFGPLWFGETPITNSLAQAFSNWHEQWRAAKQEPQAAQRCFDWAASNKQGMALARRLKDSLGAATRVFYVPLSSELDLGDAGNAIELTQRANRPYVHAPYWAMGEVALPEGPVRGTT
jgi:hypothetical protein